MWLMGVLSETGPFVTDTHAYISNVMEKFLSHNQLS